MLFSVIFTVVCCLFVVTCEWQDYTDYYSDELNPIEVDVELGSKVVLYCAGYDFQNFNWKHNGQEYKPDTNKSTIRWLSSHGGNIEVTVSSIEEAGLWVCTDFDIPMISYNLALVPTTATSVMQNMEQTSTVALHTVTTETTTAATETVNKSPILYSTTTASNVPMPIIEKVEDEVFGNIFDVLFNSVRNPYIRTEKDMALSGTISLSASCVLVFGVFIVNLFNIR